MSGSTDRAVGGAMAVAIRIAEDQAAELRVRRIVDGVRGALDDPGASGEERVRIVVFLGEVLRRVRRRVVELEGMDHA